MPSDLIASEKFHESTQIRNSNKKLTQNPSIFLEYLFIYSSELVKLIPISVFFTIFKLPGTQLNFPYIIPHMIFEHNWTIIPDEKTRPRHQRSSTIIDAIFILDHIRTFLRLDSLTIKWLTLHLTRKLMCKFRLAFFHYF